MDRNIGIAILLVTSFLAAIAQILLNLSNSKKRGTGLLYEYLNIYVVGAYGILFCTLIGNIFVLRYVNLKTAHAIAASTYLFAMLLSRIIFKEKITGKKVLGNALIIIGILLFTYSP